jgi:hypothetical protein
MTRSIRTITTAIAIAALTAPTALARPADTPQPAPATNDYAVPSDQVQKELRDNVAGRYGPQRTPQAGAAAQHKQNRRPRDANVGVYTPGAIPAVSYPSGATAGGQYTPGTTPAVSRPRPMMPAHAVDVPDTASGVSATTIGLGIAGSLIALASVVGIGRRSRRQERARLTA